METEKDLIARIRARADGYYKEEAREPAQLDMGFDRASDKLVDTVEEAEILESILKDTVHGANDGVYAIEDRDNAFKELVTLRTDISDNDKRMEELNSKDGTYGDRIADIVRAEAELTHRQILRQQLVEEYVSKMQEYATTHGRMSYSNLEG